MPSTGASSLMVRRHDRLGAPRPDTLLREAQQRGERLQGALQQQSSVQPGVNGRRRQEQQPQSGLRFTRRLLAPSNIWPATSDQSL